MRQPPARGLSRRGRRLADASPTPEYFRIHGERSATPYQAGSRPDGYIPFCVAEHGLVCALLFTTPNNPLGTVYQPAELEEIVRFAERAGIHVVFDEVYALSVFGRTPFTSIAALRPSLGDHIHIVWAFSKDFAASGLRCGTLITENRDVMYEVEALAYWACVSGDTQFLLVEMVSDDAWVGAYIGAMQSRLRGAYRAITSRLDHAGIPYLPSEAGFFLIIDLRRYLTAPTWEAEDALWRRILDEANVNLTPGSACRIAEPGFMRLCFAAVSQETGAVGVARLAGVLSRA